MDNNNNNNNNNNDDADDKDVLPKKCWENPKLSDQSRMWWNKLFLSKNVKLKEIKEMRKRHKRQRRKQQKLRQRMECDPADRMELVLVPMKQGELLNIFWNISGRTCSEPSLKKPRKCNTSTNTKTQRSATTTTDLGNSNKKKDDQPGQTPLKTNCSSGRSTTSHQKIILTLILLLSVFNSNVDAYNYNFDSQQSSNEKFHVVFEDVGQMASSVQYVFTTMTINLTRLEDSIDTYRENIKSTIKQVQNIPAQRNNFKLSELKERMINNLNIHLDDLETEKKRINDIRGHLPKPEEHPKVGGKSMHQKNKRFVLQMLFGALGTFMGMFTQNQYDKLQQDLNNQRSITKRLIEVVNTQGKAIEGILSSLDEIQSQLDAQAALNPANLDATLQSTNRKIRVEIDQVFRVIQTAQWRRLAMDFLSVDQSEELFSTLEKSAKESDSQLLIEKPSDIFQLELSYFYNGDVITLLLHVPMVPKGSLLRLVKLHPFPLPVAGNYSVVPDVDTEILALSTSQERLSAQFPATNLLGCHQVNHIFLCQSQGVLNRRLAQSCLGALYNQDFKAARTLCPMKIIHAEEVIYRLKDNDHLVYSPVVQTIPITCATKSYEKWIQRGVTEFKLEAGCRADLLHHIVYADYAISLDTGLQHIKMSRDPDMGLLNVKPEELEKLLNHMNENGLYRPTVNDILEAHGETTIIANIKEDIKSIKSSETSLQSDISVQLLTLAQVTRDIKNLKDKQERAQKMLEDEQKNSSKQMNSIYTVNESDFSTLESSKTSLTWSIAGWSIFSIVILILAAILYITVNNFRYQINTLYSAFNATNRNALRRLIIDFFTQYKLNILSNSAIQTANPQNPA
jgi:hypothetical protein